ncbi:MAG: hypothetical protein ACR2M6_04550 [Vampirovibrionia bacterium]
MNQKSLQDQLIDYYMKLIREKKMKFTDIAEKIPASVHKVFMERFTEEAREKFNKTIHPDLMTEIEIVTSASTMIDGDMHLMEAYDGSIDDEYVRTIEINFKEPRYVWAIVDDPEFTEAEDLIALRTSYEEIKKIYNDFIHLLEGSEIVQIERENIQIREYDNFPNHLWDSYIKHIECETNIEIYERNF